MPRRIFQWTLDIAGVPHSLKFDFDLSLYSHQVIHEFLSKDIFFEPGTSNLLCKALRPGDHFIDVGAHIGYFSLLAAALVGKTGRVFSLEPSAANYARLLHHIQINQFANVIPLNCAAAARNGVMDLYLEPGNDGGHALWDLGTLPYYKTGEGKNVRIETSKVFAVALDDLLGHAQADSIRALKIDVEGAEMEVLRGARQLLDRAQIPLVICECHRQRLACAGASERHLRDFMIQLGYDTYADSHTSPDLVHLDAGKTLNTKMIFNLIFAKPHLRPIIETPSWLTT